MIEILQFIFSGFYVWLGLLILIGVTCDGIAKIISALRGEE